MAEQSIMILLVSGGISELLESTGRTTFVVIINESGNYSVGNMVLSPFPIYVNGMVYLPQQNTTSKRKFIFFVHSIHSHSCIENNAPDSKRYGWFSIASKKKGI